ncbi:Bug family tripartite tricarboxylate transporter substrate binding protein [Falsiroseomonas sp. CW058]|uniref:Bug family tripartite tricarboxylate transporter substrate binding protein n=1 Tax=Falsiroseomonas sp. CW058 TaxID=3388664 RepID=UPI003D317327
MNRRTLLASALLLPAAAAAQPAWAPARPVRLVVPFAAGGSTDVAARILAERMGETLGQPVVVENRTGSAGFIGAENVARSAPDGHSLLMGATGLLAIAPHLYATMPFNVERDLAPVSMAFASDLVISVANNVPARTLPELIALAKAQPGALNYASSGAGTTTHVATELFRLAAGIELTHVPYRGSSQAMNDLMAGNVQVLVDQIAGSIGQIRDGRIRALAVTGTARHALLPDVPTVAEAGLPGAQATSWGAVMAPAGTPAPAVARLAAAVREAMTQPAVRSRMSAAGADPAFSTPEELAAFIRAENQKWGRVVRDGRITVS